MSRGSSRGQFSLDEVSTERALFFCAVSVEVFSAFRAEVVSTWQSVICNDCSTPWAIKRSQLIFVCNFVKKSTDFNAVSLLDYKNERQTWRCVFHPPHLINVASFATLPCENQNTENVIFERDITKDNCIRCIIASSMWTRAIMCLKFTHIGCYTAKRVWNKHLWHRRPAKMLEANLFWLWSEHHRCWRDHLRWYVYAGGGHFEHTLWRECSFMWFTRTLYETVNVIWCMSRLFCS